MTRDDALEVVRLLRAAWPSSRWRDDSDDIWAELLGGIKSKVGAKAARRIIATDQYFPTLARFRAACADMDPSLRRERSEDGCAACNRGWLEYDDPGRSVEPCPACKPELHARWAAGGLAPKFHSERMTGPPLDISHHLAAARDALGGKAA